MLKYKIMFQIFFVPKYFLVLKAVIFGTLLPDHPVFIEPILKSNSALRGSASTVPPTHLAFTSWFDLFKLRMSRNNN